MSVLQRMAMPQIQHPGRPVLHKLARPALQHMDIPALQCVPVFEIGCRTKPALYRLGNMSSPIQEVSGASLRHFFPRQMGWITKQGNAMEGGHPIIWSEKRACEAVKHSAYISMCFYMPIDTGGVVAVTGSRAQATYFTYHTSQYMAHLSLKACGYSL